MTDQVKCIETGTKIQLFVVTRKLCMALERCGIHVLSAVRHTSAIESSLNVLCMAIQNDANGMQETLLKKTDEVNVAVWFGGFPACHLLASQLCLYVFASKRPIFQSFGVPGGAGAQKMASLIPWIASMVLLGRDLRAWSKPKTQKMLEEVVFSIL